MYTTITDSTYKAKAQTKTKIILAAKIHKLDFKENMEVKIKKHQTKKLKELAKQLDIYITEVVELALTEFFKRYYNENTKNN